MSGHEAGWIRSRRELLGLSQRALAQRSGVKQPLISALESGRRRLTPTAREALRAELQISPSQALAARVDLVRAAVRRHGGLEAWVMGSVASGTDAPGSDVDLLVRFAEGRDIVDLLTLEHELEEVLTVPVDVVSAGSSGDLVERARPIAVDL